MLSYKLDESCSTMINQSNLSSTDRGKVQNKPLIYFKKNNQILVRQQGNLFREKLPVKFPKNRIRKQCSHNILEETQGHNSKYSIKISLIRNQQSLQKQWKKSKSKGQFFKCINKSSENLFFSKEKSKQIRNDTIQKRQKKMYPQKLISQALKNPIFETKKPSQKINILKQHKNTSSSIKNSLQWTLNKQKQKQHFLKKHPSIQNYKYLTSQTIKKTK